MDIERRTIKRWDVNIRVVFEDLRQQPRQALAGNISNKGIKLFLGREVDIGGEPDLIINLAQLGYVFVKAKACWKEIKPNGIYAGFQFTQAKESERTKIFEYITRYHREQVKRAWFK